LHGEETVVWGDSAYQGQGEVIRRHAPKAKDFTNRRYRYKDTETAPDLNQRLCRLFHDAASRSVVFATCQGVRGKLKPLGRH